MSEGGSRVRGQEAPSLGSNMKRWGWGHASFLLQCVVDGTQGSPART